MRLYYHPFSSNARRAVLTAAHLGTPVELVFIDLAKGEQRKPDFLRMNPNGKVPVLEDDGLFLHESHAIMQYLADSTPGQTIYPTERRARADVNRWLFWSAQHFQPAVGILMWERAIKGMLGQGGAGRTRSPARRTPLRRARTHSRRAGQRQTVGHGGHAFAR